MLGEPGVGKTSLSVKYCEGNFGHEYVPTLGVLPHGPKTIAQKNGDLKITVFDLGGSTEFAPMIPIACAQASALIYVFDLSRAKPTLEGIKHWYKACRLHNQDAQSYLVGSKFDAFLSLSVEQQTEITDLSKRVATAMKAPLVYVSASAGINVQTLFKLILLRAVGAPVTVPKRTAVGEPILIYD
jgi:GTP-binding protein of the ras superfamily involved in termination of M-phase